MEERRHFTRYRDGRHLPRLIRRSQWIRKTRKAIDICRQHRGRGPGDLEGQFVVGSRPQLAYWTTLTSSQSLFIPEIFTCTTERTAS